MNDFSLKFLPESLFEIVYMIASFFFKHNYSAETSHRAVAYANRGTAGTAILPPLAVLDTAKKAAVYATIVTSCYSRLLLTLWDDNVVSETLQCIYTVFMCYKL